MPRHGQFASTRSGRKERLAEPAWFRVLAQLCVLLITLGACVQACHVHDDGGPAPWKTSLDANRSQRNGPDTPANTPASPPDHCLLCVAMHAAMPSVHGAVPVPIRQTQLTTPVALLPRRLQRVSFDLFSRPPPSIPAHAGQAGQTKELHTL